MAVVKGGSPQRNGVGRWLQGHRRRTSLYGLFAKMALGSATAGDCLSTARISEPGYRYHQDRAVASINNGSRSRRAALTKVVNLGETVKLKAVVTIKDGFKSFTKSGHDLEPASSWCHSCQAGSIKLHKRAVWSLTFLVYEMYLVKAEVQQDQAREVDPDRQDDLLGMRKVMRDPSTLERNSQGKDPRTLVENSKGGNVSTYQTNSQRKDPRTLEASLKRWRVQKKRKEKKWKRKKRKKKKK